MTSTRSIHSLFIIGIIVLLILVVLIEVISWSTSVEAKLNLVNQNGGFLPYFSLLARNTLMPEIMTVFILAVMINRTRHWFNIRLSDVNWKALIRYQLIFLPTLLIAFFIFIPFTQSVRYLLIEFPTYSFPSYWYKYIVDTYSLTAYFRYLFFILLIGYSILNVSLATGSTTSRSLVAQQ